MGWIDKALNNIGKKINNARYAKVLNGYVPIFSQFGTDIYASDVVQQAVMCIVQEIKKLRPEHIRQKKEDVTPVNGTVQKILNNPNPHMTISDLLEKVTWQLFLNYNAFIIPTYTIKNGTKEYDGLYPIQPTQVDFIEDAEGEMYITFHFGNGEKYTIPYAGVIHLKYRYSVNPLMGGNAAGQPDNEALLKTLQLNQNLLKGVDGAVRSSFAVNGVVKYATMLDKDKTTEQAVKELEEKLRKSESGFLPLDLKADFIPIKKDIKLVDADTLKFIDEKILRQFGVPLPILTGDYTKAQYEAFYQKTLEPLIIGFSQAFTKVLFTEKEKGFGNKIQFYPKDLIFMSTEQTLEMIRLLGDSGTLYENEKRVALGMRPLAELEGVRKQSLNYVDVEHAAAYQMAKALGGKKDATEE